MYETNLAFCTMKMGQAPTESYTERMKHTQSTRHDSKGLPSDKRENAQQSSHGAKKTALFGVSPLISQLSLKFSSFSVAVDGNINKPLVLESVTSAVPRIT